MLAIDLCLSWNKVLNFYENSCIRILLRILLLTVLFLSNDINHNYIIHNNLKRNKYLRMILVAIKIAGDYNRWR